MKQITKFEKQLSTFYGYTFNSYSTLQLNNYYLKSYINKGCITDDPVLLDVSFEIENEIELLQNIQFCADKDAEFNTRVEHTLNIIKRYKKHFTTAITEDLSKNTIYWNRLKYKLGLQLI